MTGANGLAFRQRELYRNSRLALNFLPILHFRLITPLSDRIDRRLRQQGISGNHCNLPNRTIAHHLNIEHHRTLNVTSLRFCGILGFNPVKQRALISITHAQAVPRLTEIGKLPCRFA